MKGGVHMENTWRIDPITHEEFETILRALRFALTHSKDLEEAIRNFDEITGDIANKKDS